ncbi:MAG: hypothetical protein ACE5HQ_09010 [Gemmatimonadota bacterium]
MLGSVHDPGTGVVLPGAEVIANWVDGGTVKRAKAKAGMDGTFALCSLPTRVELSLRAIFAGRSSRNVVLTLSDPVIRQDLPVSLTGAQEAEEADQKSAEGGEPIKVKGRSKAFSASLITDKDLAKIPTMSVFELLRRNNRIRFLGTGAGQDIYVEDRGTMGATGTRNTAGSSRFRLAEVYIGERKALDPLDTLRSLRTDEVKRIEILTSTDASARFGGAGLTPVISIRLKKTD